MLKDRRNSFASLENVSEDNSTVNVPEEADKNINYKDAIDYWSSTPATVNGVLGGYGETTPVPKADVAGSTGFIRRLGPSIEPAPGRLKYALDVGAGYVFLSKLFQNYFQLESLTIVFYPVLDVLLVIFFQKFVIKLIYWNL